MTPSQSATAVVNRTWAWTARGGGLATSTGSPPSSGAVVHDCHALAGCRAVMEVRVEGSRLTWSGVVTWRHTATLREQIFDLLEEPATVRLFLDVSSVDRIDRTGVALLIGAGRWAAAMNRQLILIDRAGLITTALTEARVRDNFIIRATDGTSQQRPPD